jgi:hypothetical protein
MNQPYPRSFMTAAITLCLVLYASIGWSQTASQTFTGTGTFTVPAGVTQVTVQAWGGGGGGSRAGSGNNVPYGGGGGGAYAAGLVDVIPGNGYAVTVGVGGSGASGISPGGPSSFGADLVLAVGGAGVNDNTAAGGAGGDAGACIGNIATFSGGNGGTGAGSDTGGGGGGAGTTQPGGNASGITGGLGGSALGGNGANGRNSNGVGGNGAVIGGGGAGARRATGTFTSAQNGGNGARGQVIVTWNIPCPALNVTANACSNNTYTLNADVTTIGAGGSLAYSIDGVPQTPVSIPVAGVYTLPPSGSFSVLEAVSWTLSSADTPTPCTAVSGSYVSPCAFEVDCNAVTQFNYCYGNNDTRIVRFQAADPLSTLTFRFLSPSPIGPAPDFAWLEESDFTFDYGGGDNIDLFSIGSWVTSGDVGQLRVESDGSVSCQDLGVVGGWTLEVLCTPNCTAPEGTATSVNDCANEQYSIDVVIDSPGDATTVGISYSVNGGTPTVMSDQPFSTIIPIGPFPINSNVLVSLIHEDEPLCNVSLPLNVRDPFDLCTPANDLCANAQVLTVNTPGGCPGNAVLGSTFDANNESAFPTCVGSGIITDVWYTFTTGNNTTVTVDLVAITALNLGAELFSACGGTSIVCAAVPGSYPIAVAPFTTYAIRVFSNTNVAVAGSFSICLSAPAPPSVCGQTFQDHAGGGNYGNNRNDITYLCPDNSGEKVRLVFSQFNVAANDFLFIYDGPNLSSPLIGQFTGTSLPAEVVSTDVNGCLTLRFTSDASGVAAGYTAAAYCCTLPLHTASITLGAACAGETLQLTGNTNVGDLFTWTGPNGFGSSLQNPTIANVTTAAAGNYNLTVNSSTNGCGPVVATTQNLPTVFPPATHTLSAVPAASCVGGSSSIVAVANSGAFFNTTPISGTSGTIGDGGAFGSTTTNFTAGVSGSAGSTFNAATMTLRVNMTASYGVGIGQYTWTLIAPGGQSIELIPSGLAGNNLTNTTLLSPGGSPVITGGTSPYTGTFLPTGAITAFNGSAVDGTWTLRVVDPTLDLSSGTLSNWTIQIFGSSTTGNLPYTHSVSGPGTIGTTVLSGTNGGTGTGTTPVSDLLSGTNTYTVTTTASSGCAVTSTVDVITDVPLLVAIDGSNTLSACAGVQQNFTSTVSGGGQPYSYAWTYDGNPVGGNSPSLSFTPVASGDLVLTVTDNCATTVASAPVTFTIAPQPTLSVSQSAPAICQGVPASVSLSATGDGASYAWTPASGLSDANVANPTATPSSTTTYTVVSTGSNGCQTAATLTVGVGFNPSNLVSASSAQFACEDGTINLTSSANFPPLSFRDRFEAPAALTTNFTGAGINVNASTNPVQEGARALRLNTGNNANGTFTLNQNFNLTQTTQPTLSFWHIANTEACCDGGSFEYSLDGGGNWTAFPGYGDVRGNFYPEWTNAGLNSTNVNNPSNTLWRQEVINLDQAPYNSSTQFRIRFRMFSDGSVNYAGWFIDDVRINTQQAVTGSYAWTSVPNSFSSNLQNPTGVVVPETTTYTVTASSSIGCTSTSSVVVTVQPLETAINETSYEFCIGGTLTATSTTNFGGQPYSYAWTYNGDPVGGNSPTLTNYAPTVSGTLVLTVTDFCGTILPSAGVPVIVNPLPTVAVNASDVQYCVSDGPVVLTASGANSYAWAPAAGLDATTGAVVNATPAYRNTYTVSGTDGNGCVNTASVFVEALTIPTVQASASGSFACVGEPVDLTAVGTGTTHLYKEGFESAPTIADWAIGAGTNTVTINGGGGYFRVGANSVRLSHGNSANRGMEQQFNMDLSGLTAPRLQFWHIVALQTNTDFAFVDYSTNGGASWTTFPQTSYSGAANQAVFTGGAVRFNRDSYANWITQFTGTGSVPGAVPGTSFWQQETLDLTPWIGTTQFRVRFRITSNASTIWQGWWIDDVTYLDNENLSYAWTSDPSGFTSTDQNVNDVVVNETTTYTTTWTNAIGCTSTSSALVQVGVPLDVAISGNATEVLCIGGQFSRNAVVSGGGQPYASYAWTYNGDPVGSDPTLSNFAPTVSGTLVLTVVDNCGDTNNANVAVTVNPLPVVEVTPATASLCEAGSVELTASGALTYSWSPATGLSATTGSVVTSTLALPTTSVNYNVVGVDGNGCSSVPASAVITVYTQPGDLVASASLSNVCADDLVDLSVTQVLGGLSEDFNNPPNNWVLGNTSTGGTDPALAAWTLLSGAGPNNMNSGNGLYFVSNSDAQGSGGTTATTLRSPAFSTAGFSDINLSFRHYYRHFTGSAARVEASTDLTNWTVLATYTSTLGAPTTWNLQNLSLNAFANQPTVYVRFRFNASFGYYWGVDQVTVSTTGSNIPTWSWTSAPSSFTSSVQNPTGVSVPETTTYTVEATSGPGCSSTAEVTVSVGVPLVVTFTNTTNPISRCIGGTVSRTATVTGGGQPYATYAWTYNGDPVGTNSPTITNYVPTVSGTLLLTVTDNCGEQGQASVDITVNPLPTVTVDPLSNVNCGSESTVLTASGASTYAWSPAAGLSATTGASVTATPTSVLQPNTTVYTVTGTDGNGCVNTATASITVDSQPTAPAPVNNYEICANVSMPVNQGLSATCATTGVASASLPLSFPSAPLISEGTGFTTRSTLAVPALPAGAVVMSATLTLPSVTAATNLFGNASAGNLRIRLNGASEGSVLGETTPLPGAGSGTFTNAAPITIAPGVIPVNGGNIVFQTRQSSDNFATSPDVSIASATLTIVYEITPTPQWYADVNDITPVGTGAVFNPIQANLVDNFVPSVTTFYASCKRNDCESTRVPGVFTVKEIPVVTCGGPYAQQCTSDGLLTLVGSPAGGTWSGTGVSGNTFNPAVSGAGSFTLTYSFTNAGGCTVTCQTTIGVTLATRWYADQDGDGFGDPNTFIDNCLAENPGYVLNSTDNCPLLFGLIDNVCDANPSPSAFQFGRITPGCVCEPVAATENLVLIVQADANPTQISYEISDPAINLVICSGTVDAGAANEIDAFPCALSAGCYRLRVFDSGGDGITVGTQGGYVLRYTGTVNPFQDDQRVIDNTANFNGVFNGSESSIGSGPGQFCLPLGPVKPLYQLRDKLDFEIGRYLVCEEDAAVSAVWIPNGADNVQSTTTGYDFWLFDPNGSYSFRRFRNHATSDGFGNVGATRACHMKINNWSASQAAPSNRLLNVRIRTRVNGVNGNWGPAYRFKIDAARAACPLTLLNDFPGNEFESCNQTRPWGGTGNLIHARPVSGANRYQWRFRTVGEPSAPIIIRTTNTYFLALNWTNNPLQVGKTYEVDVRVSKTAGATWCTDAILPALVDPWGTICLLTIQGGNAQGGGENLTLNGDGNNLSLFPNPNRGDQVWLNIDVIDETVETISVDFYDLAGHRAVARIIPTQGASLNTQLELNGLAAGVYIVHITAGDKVYTERLVVTQ